MKERVKKENRNKGQALIGIVIVLIIVALFSGGLYYYLSRQTSEIPQNTQNSNEEAAKSPDVSTPPEEEKPIDQKCTDGTLYSQCSANKPKYCDNGDLIDKCVICYCSSDTVCQNGSCVQQKCSNGTLFNQCSINKPKYCDNGNLVNKCSACGCSSGKECQANGGCTISSQVTCQNECSPIGSKRCSNNSYQICENSDEDDCLEWGSATNCPVNSVCQNGSCVQQKCSDGTLYSQCSTNKPTYCDNGKLIEKCSACSCPSGTICKNNECIQATDTPGPTPFSGALNLSLDTSYSNQSVSAPKSKFKLAEFSLTNNTTEAINLKTLEVDLATGSNLYITNLYVTNLFVVYGSNKTVIFDHITHQNYWSINFQLQIGETIDLSVYGDVNSSIPLNSTIHSSVLVTGVTTVSEVTVNTNSNAVLSGQSIAFGAGLLSVGASGSTPSKTVAAGQKIAVGNFQFKSTNDSYVISELKFVIPTPLAVSIISGAVLSDSATGSLLTLKPISVSYNGNDYIIDFNVNIPIALNSSKSLTLYYYLSPAIYPNSTNINIAPILAYVKATNSMGTLIDGAAINYNNIVTSYNGITLPPSGVTVSGIYIFKSIPIFTAGSSNMGASNGSTIDLYTFSIGADPNGDISVKQLMFTITITNLSNTYPCLNNFAFFKGTSYYTNAVAMQKTENNNYIGLSSNVGLYSGKNTVIVTFWKEEIIPAGETQTYTLQAYVSKSSALGSDSVSTFIPSDTSISTNGSYLRMVAFTNTYGLSKTAQGIPLANYNLLWSDQSAFSSPHSDLNGYSSDDWYDGFGVLNFPLPTQTVIVQ